MQIARPPEGFNITVRPAVIALVDAEADNTIGFQQHWSDIIDRLKFVAHREGTADRRLGPGHRIYVSQAAHGMPKVTIVYHLLGQDVTIKMAAFAREED